MMKKEDSNSNLVLQGLLNKIILFRFTRNLDRELQNRKISHAEISRRTGRSGNWFNRTFNEIEDMRITTLIKILSVSQKIILGKQKFEPIAIDSIIDSEILEISAVSMDLSIIDIEKTLSTDRVLSDFFLKLKVYVDSMKSHNTILTEAEIDAYAQVFEQVSKKERWECQ